MTKTTSLIICSILTIAAGCITDSQPKESIDRSQILTSSRLSPRAVLTGHPAAILVSQAPIAETETSTGQRHHRLPISQRGADMAAGPDLELLSLIVACALPSHVSLVAQVNGSEIEIFGEIGLAPGWIRHPLRGQDRRWVSACVFSRLSGTDVASAISIRGATSALRRSREEADNWTIDEGAFYGDLFAQPLRWFSCQGRDGELAQFASRVCAIEDAQAPGTTRCGISYAGGCDLSCDQIRGEYRDCRAPDGSVDRQVVTVFLSR